MADDRPSRDQRDLRERTAVRFFRMINPLARRMIPAGVPTSGPNVLLVVPGRRSGIERTLPVTMLDFEGHTYVQATYGASGWGRNLRAAEEVTVVHPGGRRSSVHPVEIPPDEAAAILRHALAPFTDRVSCAGCSCDACGRQSAFCADTGCASTTRPRVPRRSAAPPALRTPAHVTTPTTGTEQTASPPWSGWPAKAPCSSTARMAWTCSVPKLVSLPSILSVARSGSSMGAVSRSARVVSTRATARSCGRRSSSATSTSQLPKAANCGRCSCTFSYGATATTPHPTDHHR
jgi:deazaflavin-dependent oxidoreductase (nitroreductase family)